MTTTTQPPGPTGAGRARTLLAYARDPFAAFTQLAREHGDVVQFMGPPMPAYLVNNPAFAEDIQTHHAWNFAPVRVLIQHRLAPQGVATATGYLHQHQRRALAPIYGTPHGAPFSDAVVRTAEASPSSWRDGASIDAQAAMGRLMLTTFARLLYGDDVLHDREELDAILAVGDYVARRATYPWSVIPEYVPILPDNRRFWRAKRVMNERLEVRIAERRLAGTEHGDLLALLLGAVDPADGSELTDAQARDTAITTIFAGATPVGQTLAWVWHLLARHPDVEARLHVELDTVLGGRSPSMELLDELVYTRMVINETLRLYPASWILGRTVLNDYELGDYRIPARSIVVLCPYVTQRDPRYFDDPDAFVPERWEPEAAAARPPYSFFPFSAGPNGCLGKQWAPTMLTLALATLAQRWRLRSTGGAQPALAPLFVLRAKGGLPMLAEQRALASALVPSDGDAVSISSKGSSDEHPGRGTV